MDWRPNSQSGSEMPNLVRSQQLKEMVIGPAKRRLKRQMQPVKALMRGRLDRNADRVGGHAARLGSCE